MNKKIWLIVAAVVIVGLAAYSVIAMKGRAGATFDPLNATYTIDGQPVTLVNGRAAAQAAPGSAAQVTTSIFGQPVSGDLNGDGKQDAAVFLVQNSGGSGTFYYVAADIATTTGNQGTNAIILGDRIAPQNIQIQNGQIAVNYADRKPGEPMSTPPSVATTSYFVYMNGMLQAPVSTAGAGESCGGNMTTAKVCATHYHCAPRPGAIHLPFGDVGGVCVQD